MREQVITIYPDDPSHRLVQRDLSVFLERVSRHLIALGAGAVATLRAGSISVDVRSWASLVVELERARVACAGREDLRIDVGGPPCERFARFLGARNLDLRFEAFVSPRLMPSGSRACWRLELRGPAPGGVGERLVDERKAIRESPFFEALEGAARCGLIEHQEWR